MKLKKPVQKAGIEPAQNNPSLDRSSSDIEQRAMERQSRIAELRKGITWEEGLEQARREDFRMAEEIRDEWNSLAGAFEYAAENEITDRDSFYVFKNQKVEEVSKEHAAASGFVTERAAMFELGENMQALDKYFDDYPEMQEATWTDFIGGHMDVDADRIQLAWGYPNVSIDWQGLLTVQNSRFSAGVECNLRPNVVAELEHYRSEMMVPQEDDDVVQTYY